MRGIEVREQIVVSPHIYVDIRRGAPSQSSNPSCAVSGSSRLIGVSTLMKLKPGGWSASTKVFVRVNEGYRHVARCQHVTGKCVAQVVQIAVDHIEIDDVVSDVETRDQSVVRAGYWCSHFR